MKKVIILTLFAGLLFQVSGQLPDPGVIMNKSRGLALTRSLTATISLTITEKNGSVRSRSISLQSQSYPDGTEKRYIKFLNPPDVRGTGMLIVDNMASEDEMWIYLPALKKIRRIVSGEKGKSFMSSEFSNADMSSPSLSDFTNSHTASSGKNNQWVIESAPVSREKAEEYGFSRKVTYMGMEDYRVQKMEFYNFDNELLRVIEVKGVYTLSGGRYLIKDMAASNLLTGRKSEIAFNNITEDQKIDESVFSVQNLSR
jgi:hypothetical protein